MTPAEAVKSITFRMETRDALAKGGTVFRDKLKFQEGSRCLHLAEAPILHPQTSCRKVYSRKETLTYVNRLERGDTSVIVKSFAIKRKPQNSEILLSEHEVEIRYLLLMTALMRKGITDAVAIPLGLVVHSRKQLYNSGFLTPEQRQNMFPERKDGYEGRYATIFAEHADGSLTDHLYKACRNPHPDQNPDYLVRAALLQSFISLAAVHSIFPSFRHNDLHASNMLVQRIEASRLRKCLEGVIPDGYPLVIEYALGNRRWQIDLAISPFRFLMWDLSFASISSSDAKRAGVDYVVPRETRTGSAVILSKTTPNHYCDIHRLVDSLRWVLRQNGGKGYEALSQKTRDMMERIVPPNLSWADSNTTTKAKKASIQMNIHAELQYTSPSIVLLFTTLFDDFRVDQIPVAKRIRPIYTVDARNSSDTTVIFNWEPTKTPVLFTM
jgi:hypothetical protein